MMIYSTVCKPGEIFYGRVNNSSEEICRFKVLSILITEAEGISYYCESYPVENNNHSSTCHFSEDDFKTLMFKTPEAAKIDFENRKRLYESMNDYNREIHFEDNLNIARKLIENHIIKINQLKKFCDFSENEFLYVKDLFQKQM